MAQEAHSVYIVLLISLLIIFLDFMLLFTGCQLPVGLTIIYTSSKLKMERGVY